MKSLSGVRNVGIDSRDQLGGPGREVDESSLLICEIISVWRRIFIRVWHGRKSVANHMLGWDALKVSSLRGTRKSGPKQKVEFCLCCARLFAVFEWSHYLTSHLGLSTTDRVRLIIAALMICGKKWILQHEITPPRVSLTLARHGVAFLSLSMRSSVTSGHMQRCNLPGGKKWGGKDSEKFSWYRKSWDEGAARAQKQPTLTAWPGRTCFLDPVMVDLGVEEC